ncbi:MAG: hypothetical protein L3J86_05725, partial [Thermoplasmata archaeon]|nr:hypothetical protein [Thermoplasmata archaeon]
SVYGKLLSFRSPVLAISPYSKEDYISHQFMDFFSLLRYVEWQFGLKCLTVLDCTAPSVFDFFDFNQTARVPMTFPTVWTRASYPMPLQNSSDIESICRSCVTTVPSEWSNNNPGTQNFTLGD